VGFERLVAGGGGQDGLEHRLAWRLVGMDCRIIQEKYVNSLQKIGSPERGLPAEDSRGKHRSGSGTCYFAATGARSDTELFGFCQICSKISGNKFIRNDHGVASRS
jgi:hypothetical protein